MSGSGKVMTALLLIASWTLQSQRVPVLPQIELPHDYYFRELYLPQLMSGPSSPDWSPDGLQLVYAMAGSLWKQDIQSQTAEQLTEGDGYDYQPDWSPDGKEILFVRYNGQSMELMLLDIASGQVTPLTANGAVNLEPKWSPDSHSIAFVSTLGTGHFLLHTANVDKDKLKDLVTRTPDRVSAIKRYYYSEYDHAINPAWSPDGNKLIFVSNREVAHGTGNIVSMDLDNPGETTTIHSEETAWKTAPDISPDGSRMVYSSYLGRNWQQLWLLPATGGYPIQITYGDYDNTSPKWSPDGKRIAYISNRTGNTSLWVIDSYVGKEMPVVTKDLHYLRPRKDVVIKTVDALGRPIPARVSVLDGQGKFYAPRDVWIHGDDSRYPKSQQFETHYFHSTGIANVSVPAGIRLKITAQKGPDYQIATRQIAENEGLPDTITIPLSRWEIPASFGRWWSGDLHVHMNYTGNYRNTTAILREQARAENVDFIYNLIVNKEQRIPDLDYYTPPEGNKIEKDIMILQGQEYHTSFWGHLGLLNLTEHYLVPDYVGYPYTAVASIFPHNSYIADEVHRQNGLIGYVHPFYDFQLFPKQSETLTNALPVDAALGNVDYYEVVGFAHHKASAAVWYMLLNCGLRIPAGAGTDAMANYASLRGPVGLNRVYVEQNGTFTSDHMIEQVKRGKSFVTNGALLGLTVNGSNPGDTIEINGQKTNLQFRAFLRSAVPVDHLEVVWNGRVIHEYAFKEDRNTADFTGQIEVDGPGWMVLRAFNDEAHPDIPDYYPYATTSPIYITSSGKKLMSRSSAVFLLEWIGRIEKIVSSFDAFRTMEEKELILKDLNKARKFYENCFTNATIE